jgi:hypothetical protein
VTDTLSPADTGEHARPIPGVDWVREQPTRDLSAHAVTERITVRRPVAEPWRSHDPVPRTIGVVEPAWATQRYAAYERVGTPADAQEIARSLRPATPRPRPEGWHWTGPRHRRPALWRVRLARLFGGAR